MTVVGIACETNRPLRRDGDEFVREAQKFVRLNGGRLFRFGDGPIVQRRTAVYASLHEAGKDPGLDTVGFFCHGTPGGIQAGFSVETAEDLARHIPATVRAVVLYACSAGAEGGFAQELSMRCGADVIGHATRGHATRNPHLVLWQGGEGRPLGGSPGPLMPRAWREWRSLVEGEDRFRLHEMARRRTFFP